METWKKRTELLVGKPNIKKLKDSHIFIAGLGGVGGYVAEQLVRAGIGHLTILDHASINESNKNRQIFALNSTTEQQKSIVAKKRFEDINPKIKITTIPDFLSEDNVESIVPKNINFIADCIDTLTPKSMLIEYAIKNHINIISAMGAGGKLDPSKIEIADISETHVCRLSYHLRKRLRNMGINKGLNVVFSSERVSKNSVAIVPIENRNQLSVAGTISYMPALFGCFVASAIIRDIIK